MTSGSRGNPTIESDLIPSDPVLQVVVHITDENDCTPEFLQSIYTRDSVPETVAPGTSLLQGASHSEKSIPPTRTRLMSGTGTPDSTLSFEQMTWTWTRALGSPEDLVTGPSRTWLGPFVLDLGLVLQPKKTWTQLEVFLVFLCRDFVVPVILTRTRTLTTRLQHSDLFIRFIKHFLSVSPTIFLMGKCWFMKRTQSC